MEFVVTSAVSGLDSCWAWITVRLDALDTLFCSSSSPELVLVLWSSRAPLAMISWVPEMFETTGRGEGAGTGSRIEYIFSSIEVVRKVLMLLHRKIIYN